MKLIVIGSSSSGNGYALQSESGELLLVEAGVKPKVTFQSLGYRIKAISGIVVSHTHGDHAKYINEYSHRGILVGANEDVISKRQIRSAHYTMQSGHTYAFGSFRVTPFDVKHDVPNFGYLIYHKECGAILFATDTFTLPYAFKNVKHFLIEANYSDAILKDNLESGVIDKTQASRLMVSHMSLENCIKNLSNCNADTASTITLIHLSSRNSHANDFRKAVQSKFGIPVYIADKGLTVDLS